LRNAAERDLKKPTWPEKIPALSNAPRAHRHNSKSGACRVAVKVVTASPAGTRAARHSLMEKILAGPIRDHG
jgi:hypothetical protein